MAFWMAAAAITQGAGTAAFGLLEYQAQGKMKKYALQEANVRATAYRRQAKEVLAQGRMQSGAVERMAQYRRSAIRAQFAGSGTTMQGSPTEVMAEQAATDEFNRLVQQRNLNFNIEVLRRQASNAKTAGANEAAGIDYQRKMGLLKMGFGMAQTGMGYKGQMQQMNATTNAINGLPR